MKSKLNFLFYSTINKENLIKQKDEKNDTNNNDKAGDGDNTQPINTNKIEKDLADERKQAENADADSKPNKNDDDFNFDDFSKVENITDLLSSLKDCKESEDIASNESRFSRWFAKKANSEYYL